MFRQVTSRSDTARERISDLRDRLKILPEIVQKDGVLNPEAGKERIYHIRLECTRKGGQTLIRDKIWETVTMKSL